MENISKKNYMHPISDVLWRKKMLIKLAVRAMTVKVPYNTKGNLD